MKASIKLCLGPFTASVYEALKAEENQPAPEKGEVSIALSQDCLLIRIASNTISGLRALANSFLLLAHASYCSLVEASRKL
ncbi:MAG: hypothetical protein F7C35_01210 [Desulfurococcales archaeon]|nr:hypothetical protein [Desulfurococcales archaeon]